MSVHANAWKGVRIEDMREWFADCAEAESIRALAERAGVQHSTLHGFLRGSIPHPRIRMKLAALYLQGSEAGRAVEGAVAVLLTGMPDDTHIDGRADLLAFVGELHRRAGVSPPGWAG